MRVPASLLLVGGLASVLFSGCGSDTPHKAVLASGCAINSDCDAPLVCAFQRCHQQCSSTRDCTIGEQCIAAAGTGVCQLTDESTCTKDVDCKLGQVCDESVCRAGCRDDSACLSSQRCVAFACIDQDVDGGQGEGGTPSGCSTATLDTDCPANECRKAAACSAEGECVYQPLAPTSCGTCGLGKPSCADETAPACDDIEVLGVSALELECDSTLPTSTFVYLDPTFGGAKGNGSAAKPFAQLAKALAAATTAGRGASTIVIAGSPVFEQTLVLPDGVSVRGGYSATDDTGAFTGVWRRDLSNRPIWRVPDTQLSDNVLVALRAEHVHQVTIVADVTLQTEVIHGTGVAEGASNIGVLANDSDGLRLFDVTVLAGGAQAGGQGDVGAAGTNGPNMNGANATLKGYGAVPTRVAGLAGAHNSLCNVSDSIGGDGGDQGPADYPGRAAPSGAKGDTGTGAASGAQISGPAATGSSGAGDSRVSVNAVFTPLGVGGTGTDGAVGHGGGGGESKYGNDANAIFFVAPGGSGAAGGCGGLGGIGGFPGGWSIGMLTVASPGLVVRGGSCASSAGGDGGPGNQGGKGAPGGTGGTGTDDGNNTPYIISTKGGNGSGGQQGGVGGVGAGGSSIALYCSKSTPTLEQGTVLTTGAVGAGGTPVAAAPMLGCDAM